ncbi:DUF998 domain-containing protein [Streptomyces prasinopilosus]|uniref:Hypothetical membrane protein n=2 Tax=Streptomyces prasinopilosus TaxID=67344 RepID=A0A1G6I9R5_9ACTN|nr:DUF998 domain-containing protein [Streptomyces prasinopilosus]SDC02486.1 hypothetical membrane protein [Streptomyces prasinopilosus]
MRERIGYAAWIAGVAQFFVVHGIVESVWTRPTYSWARNNISDLGNVHCGLRTWPESRYICSPGHGLMNGSFIVLGVLLVVGLVLTGRTGGDGGARGGVLWRGGRVAALSRTLLAGGGAGFVLIGLAPTDVHTGLHVVGAALLMGAGNAGLVLAGSGLADRVPRPLRRAAGLLGTAALLAFGLFLSGHYLGLGMGGMERVAAYPLLCWVAALGLWGVALRAGRARAPVAEGRAGGDRVGPGPAGG